MNKSTLKITTITLAIAVVVISCGRPKDVNLRFINPLKIDRNDEIVTINYNDFSNLAGDLPSGMLPLFFHGTDTLISQNIDLNKDGTPEEILVEISLKSGEQKDIKVELIPVNEFPAFPKKTNLHFARLDDPQKELDSMSRVQSNQTAVTSTILQMEGPGWENEKVGFRNYYDLRNGIDIFGKNKSILVLDTIGIGIHSYHLMSNWGMDILKVANSLGTGAIGMEKEGKLYRIGDNGQSGFERIYEGPLKSEFSLHFKNWKAGNDSFDIVHYISITAGLYCYESSVFANFPDDSYQLISGFVNKYADSLIFIDSLENFVIMASHSNQSEDKSALGMALLIPREYFLSNAKAPASGEGITETFYAGMPAVTKFLFYAGWAKEHEIFESKEGFLGLIRQDALKRENQIIIQKLILP